MLCNGAYSTVKQPVSTYISGPMDYSAEVVVRNLFSPDNADRLDSVVPHTSRLQRREACTYLGRTEAVYHQGCCPHGCAL
jgi:hypothetical protein